ncbi:MAG: hypothetical protein ABI685_13110 [Ferruginibacter sp.]
MAGLNHNFYKGNLSELLADYLLSSIGITTPTRRQFDIGIDFYCNLSDNESGYLTFGYPFLIQIKSKSSPKILYGGKTHKNWKIQKIEWLFRNEIPLFIGIVDKKNHSMCIYDTSGLWQLFLLNEKRNFSQVLLVTGDFEINEWRENVKTKQLTGWENTTSDGVQYIVNMGNPIVEITSQDVDNPIILKRKKEIFRNIIQIEQRNINHRNLGINCFQEIKKNQKDLAFLEWGMNISNYEERYIDKLYHSLRMPLVSLSNNLQSHGRIEEANKVKNILKHIEPLHFYSKLFLDNPEYFDWIKEIINPPDWLKENLKNT